MELTHEVIMTTSPKGKPAGKTAQKPKDNGRLWAWLFIVAALVGIVLLIMASPHEHTLSCSGRASLTSFGSCHED